MRIMFVAGEAAPFAASGGLGDVMGALPKALADKLGSDSTVSVVLPLYASVNAEYRQRMKKITEFWFYHSWRNAYCGVFLLNDGGVDYYFIDNEYYFKRANLYGDFDDGERFAYFSHAVMEFILRENLVPDILHANDWQAALTVIYAKLKYGLNPMLADMKTVFTIHNIEYQGKYGCETLGDIFDIDRQDLPLLEYDGCINLLKGAMVCADRITTVSPNYRDELQSDFFAFGLQHIVRMCGDKMNGIVNGIDTKTFSSRNGDIPFPFAASNFTEGKANNKEALQKELGLSVSKDTPLIAMVTRLTDGKGVELVIRILDELLSQDVQFVLLGTGDKKYEAIFSGICARYPDRARALLKFDRRLSKNIYAGADIFLMPSKSEPCGLAQMIACSYGTVPLVRNVGGLHDTIIPCGDEGANGFRFDNFNAHDMYFTLKEALRLYRDNKKAWKDLAISAMTTDFTWKKSAEAYQTLYESVLKK